MLHAVTGGSSSQLPEGATASGARKSRVVCLYVGVLALVLLLPEASQARGGAEFEVFYLLDQRAHLNRNLRF